MLPTAAGVPAEAGELLMSLSQKDSKFDGRLDYMTSNMPYLLTFNPLYASLSTTIIERSYGS